MRPLNESSLRSTFLLGIGLAISASLPAQIRITAMLTATGHVNVNGANIAHTTAVVTGDRVQTSNDGAATISLPGSAVVIPADSAVVFRGDHLEIQTGTADVTTTRGMRAQVERYAVVPAGKRSARFSVARLSDSIVITAAAGNLTITGAGTTMLAAGNSAIINKGAEGLPPVVSRAAGRTGKGVAAAGLGGGTAAVASTVARRRSAEASSPVEP